MGEIEKAEPVQPPRDYGLNWWTAVLPDAELDHWSFRYKGTSMIQIRPAGEHEWTNQIQLDSEGKRPADVTDEWLMARAEEWIEDRNDERPGFHTVIEHWTTTPDENPRMAERVKSHDKWPSDVAPGLVAIMREADDRFSGMEDFGEAHEFWNDGHTCPEDGSSSDECKELELESCREWIEKALDELKDRESKDFHLNIPGGFVNVKVTYRA